jgi:N6-adenosine-specific RNA methylase IME4
MTDNPFRVVVADPPWAFGDKLPGKTRGAERQYRTMSVERICDMQLPPVADDAFLFLWRVAAMVEEAYLVCRHWGFVPKTEFVWEKLTVTGKPWFGMGRILRASHEICIIATRGRPRPLIRNVRSRFAAPVGRHSQKPEAFFDLVEKLDAGPYLELFARRQRPGWTCLGDQA